MALEGLCLDLGKRSLGALKGYNDNHKLRAKLSVIAGVSDDSHVSGFQPDHYRGDPQQVYFRKLARNLTKQNISTVQWNFF